MTNGWSNAQELVSFILCSSYDHLTRLLIKVMDEQPQDVVEVIEDMSRDLKRALFKDKQSTLRDLPHTTPVEMLAEQQLHLFRLPEDSEQDEELGIGYIQLNCLFVLAIWWWHGI